MIVPSNQLRWGPEEARRHSVRVLRGWVIALSIIIGIGMLVLGALFVALVFRTPPFPIVVSSPRDCRLSDDHDAPRLYVALDATAMSEGDLAGASPINRYGRTVEAVGVVRSLPPLSALDDAVFESIVENADEVELRFGADASTGVIVAVIDTGGETSGHLYGLRTMWVLGEPAVEQDLPLGIDFTPTSCTVTMAE